MKYSVLILVSALLLSACGTARDRQSQPRAIESTNPDEQITWVLVLIDLNHPTQKMTIEGSYNRMDKCFFKREEYFPGYPKPGTQGLCIQMK